MQQLAVVNKDGIYKRPGGTLPTWGYIWTIASISRQHNTHNNTSSRSKSACFRTDPPSSFLQGEVSQVASPEERSERCCSLFARLMWSPEWAQPSFYELKAETVKVRRSGRQPNAGASCCLTTMRVPPSSILLLYFVNKVNALINWAPGDRKRPCEGRLLPKRLLLSPLGPTV